MLELDKFCELELDKLKQSNRLRVFEASQRLADGKILRDGQEYISFSCNDYLGLSMHPEVINAAIEGAKKYGAGAGASRLLTGNSPIYDEAENLLAEYKEVDAACIFGSGYLSNVGVIPLLAKKGDLIIADRLVHSSIISGCKLSEADFIRFKHNDISGLEGLLQKNRQKYNKILVITETVFGMDGDLAPLKKIKKICLEFDAWLMTDDAHGFGLINSGDYADIQMGTFSKAIGAYGGYICGSRSLVNYVKSASKSMMFSTGLPASVISSIISSINLIKNNKIDKSIALNLAKRFCNKLNVLKSESHIVPIILGDENIVMEMAEYLKNKGFLVAAIRPPTVPVGTSRLRISFSSVHNAKGVDSLADAILASKWWGERDV